MSQPVPAAPWRAQKEEARQRRPEHTRLGNVKEWLFLGVMGQKRTRQLVDRPGCACASRQPSARRSRGWRGCQRIRLLRGGETRPEGISSENTG